MILAFRTLLLLVVVTVGCGSAPDYASAGQNGAAVANDARLGGDAKRTRFVADLSKKVDFRVFALADPYRVIVDLPDVNFQLPSGVGQESRGLVTAYRYGLFAPGKSRIVIDVSGPVLIDKSYALDAADGQPARLVIDLVPTDAKTFLAKSAEAPPPPARQSHAPAEQPPAQIAKKAKPVIVIDPGHGGIDPGATSPNGITEKSVVFEFARALKKTLDKDGRYEVHLTRTIDTVVPLRDRTAMARAKGASLFISVHADSLSSRSSRAVRGSAIYTLSERASDDEARALAAKENKADIIAGVDLPPDSDEVTNILIELAQRETNNLSAHLAHNLAGEMRRATSMHRKPIRSAGFAVLKAPDLPSVLLELGYLTNKEDEKLLTSDAWRIKVAASIKEAVDNYFAKQMARVP